MSHPFDQSFPRLQLTGYTITSPADRRYNCIAWAAGDQTRWWWPDASECGHWPDGVAREWTTSAFIAAFATLGYAPCSSSELEQGVEKIALYVSNGRPTHAARQLPDGTWTSKCGRAEDIRHALGGLSGEVYGEPTVFLSRPRRASE